MVFILAMSSYRPRIFNEKEIPARVVFVCDQ